MILLNLLLIQLILVFIIDLSGVMTSLKLFISKWLTKGKMSSTNFELKPFTCSLCMTWWVGLIYLLIARSFTLPLIAFTALLAFLTPVAKDVLITGKDMLTWIVNQINKITIWKN